MEADLQVFGDAMFWTGVVFGAVCNFSLFALEVFLARKGAR